MAGMGNSGMGGGGTGGTGGGPAADGGALPVDGGASPGPCTSNPDTDNEACPEICPEACNGEDDDCDGSVDEGEADAVCSAPNAVAVCSDGECIIASCSQGYRDCDSNSVNGCESDSTDVNNCGVCGNVCSFVNAIAACVNGGCEPAGCVELFDDCDGNALDCETAANTLANCGACGVACADVPNATADCTTGTCGPGACADGYDDCDGDPMTGCEQSLTDLNHCGACNVPCDFDTSTADDCSTGVCRAGICDPGYDDCDGDHTNGCESLETDTDCGGCGMVCDSTLVNVDSAACSPAGCALSCLGGFGDCDNNPYTGCEASLTSLTRCGDCGTPCAVPNAVVSCATGQCEFQRCADGWGNCDGDLSDGCEQRLDLPEYCGSCTNDCSSTTSPFCSAGQCTAVDCTPPSADCDGDGASCEVADTTSDPAHCGACNNACQFTTNTPHAAPMPVCVNGQCRPVCNGLWDDCNGDYADGCETSLETLSDCGSCGASCSIQNAMETCAGGTCGVADCELGYGDCDSDPLTCETSLDSVQHCGDCSLACDTTNANPSCVGSPGARNCVISSCTESYYQDCDLDASTGCEEDTRSASAHCGQCNFDCRLQDNVASATCSNSGCNFSCDNGFDDCNGEDGDGCETPLNTLQNCTGCGVSCSRNNGMASCTSGTCQLTGCNPGHLNCDNDPTNGCEPLNTLQNCGACGVGCSIPNGSADCGSGTCAVGMCDAGWDDCDGDPANGCEQDVRPPAQGGNGPCFPDTGCSKLDYAAVSYYFCTTERDWTTARDNCRLLVDTQLVRIDDAGENAFVTANIVADSFIGANDRSVEGEWRWAALGTDDGAQFWQGDGATGSSVGGLYQHWVAADEPNGGDGSDCGRIVATGDWRDIDCASSYDYVCEQNADLCPADPNKTEPGICGCGVPDDDDDLDLVPNCNDGCPTDMGKVAPGQCGCGTPDTDTDSDGTADCNDQCPMNAAKTVAPCSWQPDNYDPALYPHAAVVNFDCGGVHTFDSTSRTWDTNCCGTCPDVTSSAVDQTVSGGPQVVILSMASLGLAAGTTIRLIGDYPVIFSVDTDAMLAGTIDAGSEGTGIGAGGDYGSCGNGNGANGGASSGRGAGGGGGGFGSVGGAGGGSCLYCCPSSPAAGQQNGGATLSPLRGGCRGGTGGSSGGSGGSGGGAVQIAVQGMLTIEASGVLSSAGGGGVRGPGNSGGGGGGGSGGAVLLEHGGGYSNLGAVRVHGGGGGEAGSSSSTTGNGEDGHRADDTRAAGGTGGGGPDGGEGATRCVSDGASCTAGDANATAGTMNQSLICVGGGGSGGGGGRGRVAVTAL